VDDPTNRHEPLTGLRGSRRQLLRLLALGSGAALLAACGQQAPAPPPAAPAKPAEAAKPTAAPAKPAEAAKPAAAPAAPAAAAAPTTATAKPAEAAKPAAAPTAAPAAKAAAPTGKVTVSQNADPRSLWASSSTNIQEINYSELIEFSPDGATFEPRLATEWKQLDDTTLQVKLRQGVKFTNGEPFDAEAAKFSLGVMSNSAALKAFTSVVVGAEVVDQYTVNVKTASPTPLHLPALAMGSFMYPPKYFQEVGQDEFGKKPVGTGPFVFSNWVKDSAVTFEANEGYWNGAPAFKTLVIRTIPEDAARVAALETGEIDFLNDLAIPLIDRVERAGTLQTYSVPSNRVWNLAPSTLTDTPLKDPKVRQALWYALDVPALLKGLYQGRGKALERQAVSEGYFGHVKGLQPTTYDPDRVKQLLTEAGHPNGFEFDFKISAAHKELGQAVAAQLAKVNLRARQEVLEPGTYLTMLSQLKLNDMRISGSLPPPDAHFQYQVFETGFRYSYYSNPKFDEMLRKGATTINRDERLQVYKDIQALLEGDPPFAPMFHLQDFYAASKKVTGFTPRVSQFMDLRALKPA
jgi:peptide/nickel transport system substrate-binding protein